MAPARWLQRPDISAIVPSREVGFKGIAGEGDDVQHFRAARVLNKTPPPHLSVKFLQIHTRTRGVFRCHRPQVNGILCARFSFPSLSLFNIFRCGCVDEK